MPGFKRANDVEKKSAAHFKPLVARRPDPAMHRQGRPNLRRHPDIDAGKSGRRHSDDGEGVTIQRQSATNDVAITAKFLPKLVTDNRDRMPVRRGIFLRQESASQKRVELEQIEIIPADQLAENIGGFAGARHADPGEGVTGHSGEDAVLLLVIEKIKIRIRIAPGEVTVAGKKLHHPIGMSDREADARARC